MKKRLVTGMIMGWIATGLHVHAQSVATVLDHDLFEPHSVAVVDETEIYITDSANDRIVFYNPDTDTLLNLAGSAGETGYHNAQGIFARFFNPQGIIVARGGLVVADSGNHAIRFVSFNGEVTTLAGAPEGTPADERLGLVDGPGLTARFRFPTGLAADEEGNIFIADTLNNVIRKLDVNNVVTTVATDNPNEFFQPSDLDIASEGRLVIADSRNHAIKMLEPDGGVTLLAGSASRVSGAVDSTFGTAALFNTPRGVLWLNDRDGILVSDTKNHVIRRVFWNNDVAAWSVETVTGVFGESGEEDGSLGEARLNSPTGIADDKSGGFLIVDLASSSIRRLQRTPTQPPVSNPKIGWVDFVQTQFGDIVSVLRPVTQAVFNNDVIIATLTETGTETFFTSGPTSEGFADDIPDPNRDNGSSPPFYKDGLHPGEVPASMVGPMPDLTIKLRSFANNRLPSAEVAARFLFKTATPGIQGENAAAFSVTNITENTVMYYTIDGSDPTNDVSNPSVFGPIESGARLSFQLGDSNLVFKVRGFRDHYAPSEIAMKEFTPTNFVPNRITFGFEGGEASSDFVASAGQRFYAPVTLSVLQGQKMYGLQFNLTVTNLFDSPPVQITEGNGGVGFHTALVQPDPILKGIFHPIPPKMLGGYITNVQTYEFVGEQRVVTNETGGEITVSNTIEEFSITNVTGFFTNLTFTNPVANLLGVGWLERFGQTNLYDSTKQDLITFSLPHDTLFESKNGKVVVGSYNVQIPTSAQVGDQYEIQIGRPSATEDGIRTDAFIQAPTNGALAAGKLNAIKHITVGQRHYIVGDAVPFRWFNAGDFGDTNLLNNDLTQVFQSVAYDLNTPPPGSDFFDAMDSSDGLFNAGFGASSGADLEINDVMFGDGSLNVDDIWVTFRRALDPTLKWYARFWEDGVRKAVEVPNQFRGEIEGEQQFQIASAEPKFTAAGHEEALDRPLITFHAEDFVANAGETATVPIEADVPTDYALRVLMLNLSVEPLDGAPPIQESVSFSPNPVLGDPTLEVSKGAGNYAAAWLNNQIAGLTGKAVLGSLAVPIPETAGSQAAYRIVFERVSASPNGLALFDQKTEVGIVTMSNRADSSWDDEIPDTWRLRNFGTTGNLLSHAYADADGDGLANWAEYEAGTDPNDFQSRLELLNTRLKSGSDGSRIGEGIALRWPTVSGKHYVIECSPALVGEEWVAIGELDGDGSLAEFVDEHPLSDSQFYRVRLAE